MCTYLSQIMAINRDRLGEEEFEKRLERAVGHLEFACHLYRIELAQGGYILHEHPAYATSWAQDCMTNILNKPRVQSVIAHMCAYGW